MTTFDPWLNAKIAECEAKERKAIAIMDAISIDKVIYRDGRAYINESHSFEVPGHIWTYCNAYGHQVAMKWLMDRRHSVLSEEDMEEYRNLIEELKKELGEEASTQNKIICIEWQTEVMKVPSFLYFHAECLLQKPEFKSEAIAQGKWREIEPEAVRRTAKCEHCRNELRCPEEIIKGE